MEESGRVIMKILMLLLLMTSFLCDLGTAQAPPLEWYPNLYHPRVLVRGAEAGRETTVCALYVEYNSPAPTQATFLIGRYQQQYVQAIPGIGVLHIPSVMFMREFWLRMKYPAHIIEFPLFSGYIHPSLRGTEWCLQAYFSWGPWGKWGEPHWLSYPVRIIIQ